MFSIVKHHSRNRECTWSTLLIFYQNYKYNDTFRLNSEISSYKKNSQ